jgi:hypothetical protein
MGVLGGFLHHCGFGRMKRCRWQNVSTREFNRISVLNAKVFFQGSDYNLSAFEAVALGVGID